MPSALSLPRFFLLLRAGLLAMVLLPLLSGCGGGLADEDDDGYTITSLVWSPSAPTSGTPVSVTSTVTTTGNIKSSDLVYAWTQTSGPAVTLTGADTATVYFTAPTVSVSTDVVLKLTVTSGSLTANKSATITISP
ncbi:hypothetical protein [Viridibacterium curvum]|uniref:Uncharacterized protein n=1 Tax=Viridibacterium curvum TaxID=1101404 RepID=A0ABP9QQ29_9RHOO